ncbi:MAG: hypothetical protein E6Q33_04565 [Neisseriales bacterium]|nr:MAG: hypothetical protein E6Q33_04565 [Neisseriales bacterium]
MLIQKIIGNVYDYHGWQACDVAVEIIDLKPDELKNKPVIMKKMRNGCNIIVNVDQCGEIKNGDILWLKDFKAVVALTN